MMRILYVGNFYPRQLMNGILHRSRGRIVFSNHIFETNLLKGLSEQSDIDLVAITVPNVGSYPGKNRSLFTRKESYTEGNMRVESVGFFNLWPFFRIHRYFALRRTLRSVLRESGRTPVRVILSAPAYYAQKAMKWCLRKHAGEDIKVTALLPDIPVVMEEYSSSRGLRRYLKNKISLRSMSLLQEWNSYILLTDTMRDFLPADCRSMVMEGIVDPDAASVPPQEKASSPIIAYTGVVDRCYGVGMLLDAFASCNVEGAQLWIAGSGPMRGELEEAARNNPSIRYFGLVSPRKAAEIRAAASVLVNPRTSSGRFTRYSFPSKTMEYLLSGKVTVAFMLPGIPEEYRPYMLSPDQESADSLALTLHEALTMSPEDAGAFGSRGRTFVLQNKNISVQAARIVSFL